MAPATFKAKADAMAWRANAQASINQGSWVARSAGRVTFHDYGERWRVIQVHREGTADQVRTNLTRHVFPRLGRRPMSGIRPSEIQALVKSLSETLAPATVEVVYAWVSTIFRAAVADRVIAVSPCTGVKLPQVDEPKAVVIWAETVAELAERIQPRYRAVIVLGAGSGVRIAEALGLTTDQVGFLRRTITIDRQLRRTAGPEPTFGPVKDKRNRPRTIPVGQVVLDELAAHIAEYGVGPSGLIFTSSGGGKVTQSTWSDA